MRLQKLTDGRCAGIDIESVRAGQVKVPEIYWWKHSQQCQGAFQSLTLVEAVREMQVFDPDHEVCAFLHETTVLDIVCSRILVVSAVHGVYC